MYVLQSDASVVIGVSDSDRLWLCVKKTGAGKERRREVDSNTDNARKEAAAALPCLAFERVVPGVATNGRTGLRIVTYPLLYALMYMEQ